MIEDQDFRFLDFKDSDITGIELLLPEYLGVVFHFGKVKIEENGETAKVTFGYTLVYPGDCWSDIDELNEDKQFHSIMGEILDYILQTQSKLEEMNGTGNFNPQEPNL